MLPGVALNTLNVRQAPTRGSSSNLNISHSDACCGLLSRRKKKIPEEGSHSCLQCSQPVCHLMMFEDWLGRLMLIFHPASLQRDTQKCDATQITKLVCALHSYRENHEKNGGRDGETIASKGASGNDGGKTGRRVTRTSYLTSLP